MPAHPPELPTPPSPSPTRRHWTTAAIVTTALGVIFVSLLLYLLRYTPADLLSREDYITGTGEQRTIPLRDGSTIHMNTESRLRVEYTTNERIIYMLEGEALFTVAKDSSRPFRVLARHTVVEALGTEFSVYLANLGTKIAVTEGRVKVFENREPAPVIVNPLGHIWTDTVAFTDLPPEESHPLSAGEEANVKLRGDASGHFEVETWRVSLETLHRQLAWVNGQLDFGGGETLQTAVAEFNRYNWRKLRIADRSIANKTVGGTFGGRNPEEFAATLEHLGIHKRDIVDPTTHEQVIELTTDAGASP